MQFRWYGLLFLWVIFSFLPVLPQDLPDSFREEWERIEQDGFQLKDHLYLSDDASLLLLLLENPQEPRGRVSEMRIYRFDSQGARLLSKEVVEKMALAFHQLNNTDINNDGSTEIVIWKGCGGTAWSCQQIGIYQIRENRFINLSQPIAGSLFPSSLVDLDQDGSLEIIAMETRWETYEHLPHPAAPSVEEIFAWSNGSYRKATMEYPDYYQQKISQIESLMDQVENPYDYLGHSIKLLLNYDRMGQADRGWKEFERLLQTERRSIVASDVWQSLKDPILEDFIQAR